MLKIKLARFGKKHQPHYRLVVTEARSKRDGKYVAKVGHYAPTQQPKILEIDIKRYQYWIKQGAIPTNTVAELFKRYQSGNPFPAKKQKLSKKTKAKQLEKDQQRATAASPNESPTHESDQAQQPNQNKEQKPNDTAEKKDSK